MALIYRLLTLGLWNGPPRYPVGDTEVTARQRLPAPRVTEYQRTCDRCGHQWYITPKERKTRAPNGLQMAGLKMQSAGNRGKLIGGKKKAIIAEQRIARLQGQRDRVDQISRCSECGSTSFTEILAQ